MMQTDITRHTIDYWICIHHRYIYVGCLCAGVLNAQTGLLSMTQCVHHGFMISYKLNKQSEQWVLCFFLSDAHTLALAPG